MMSLLLQLESHPEYGSVYQLLQLFACGVYQDYLQRKQELPQLSDMQRLKLRHLTIVTMSTQTKVGSSFTKLVGNMGHFIIVTMSTQTEMGCTTAQYHVSLLLMFYP